MIVHIYPLLFSMLKPHLQIQVNPSPRRFVGQPGVRVHRSNEVPHEAPQPRHSTDAPRMAPQLHAQLGVVKAPDCHLMGETRYPLVN